MLRPTRKLQDSNTAADEAKSKMMGETVMYLLHSVTQAHLAHLKTTSYAAHMALGSYYEELPELVDNVAEQYQGATGYLLSCPGSSFTPVASVEDFIPYLKMLHDKVTSAQESCEYSEIGNELDNIKSLIDKTLYKLKFLK